MFIRGSISSAPSTPPCPSAATLLLLATTDDPARRWETVRSVFRHTYAQPYLSLSAMVLIVAGVVLGALGLVYLAQRRRAGRGRPRPARVFHRLARELGLAATEQWLLARIARQQALPSPVTLLVSPATLDHHARAYAGRLGAGRQRRVLVSTRRIGEKLFGGGASEGEASAAGEPDSQHRTSNIAQPTSK